MAASLVRVTENKNGGIPSSSEVSSSDDSSLDSGTGTDTTSETYQGAAPFSEPETQSLRAFVENKSFATAHSFHSGINATYFPWASEDWSWAESNLYYQIYSDFLALWPNLDDYLGRSSSGKEPQRRPLPSTLAGDWGDRMYAEKDCLVPMTNEIVTPHQFRHTWDTLAEESSGDKQGMQDVYRRYHMSHALLGDDRHYIRIGKRPAAYFAEYDRATPKYHFDFSLAEQVYPELFRTEIAEQVQRSLLTNNLLPKTYRASLSELTVQLIVFFDIQSSKDLWQLCDISVYDNLRTQEMKKPTT